MPSAAACRTSSAGLTSTSPDHSAGAGSAAVVQVVQCCDRVRDDVVARVAAERSDEGHPAGVVLEGGVIEPALGHRWSAGGGLKMALVHGSVSGAGQPVAA